MPLLVIELDPSRMAEPDPEIRHDLPALLEAASAGAMVSAGHDQDEDDKLLLYLQADDLVAAQQSLIRVLDSSLMTQYDLSTCRVGVRDRPGTDFDVVWPEGEGGVIAALDVEE